MSVAQETVADRMEAQLLAWGAFRAGGGCGDGYPSMSVIHPNWTIPAKGMQAKLPMPGRSSVAERALDARIAELSVKMRDALFVRYVKRLALAEQARMLGCEESTVGARVQQAKRILFYELF